MSFLLRLALPDRPGALGAVATALGTVGGDILSLDVVERTAERAVDDLVVDLPPGGLADALVSAAVSVPGVEVESIRPYAAVLDPYRELELLDALVERPDDALHTLADGVARIFRAGWAVVLSAPSTGGGVVPVVAASAAAPEVTEFDIPDWPLSTAESFTDAPTWAPDSWRTLDTQLAWAPLGKRTIMVGRPAMRWLPAEVIRLSHLAGIAAGVLAD